MAEKFDPYYAWLGIPPDEQPPNHYRLLGLEPFEEKSAVIEAAADQRAGNLHAFQKGERAGLAMRLLNEVSVAKVCLLNPNRKAGYDTGLRERLELEARQAEQIERDNTKRFLEILQEKDLLPAEVIAELRKQLAVLLEEGAEKSISTAAVANRLVVAGHLTSAIADRLLATVLEETSASASPGTSPFSGPQPKAPQDHKRRRPSEEDYDLDLAPLDDEPGTRRPARKSKATAKPKPTAQAEPTAGKTEPKPPAQADVEPPPVQAPPAPAAGAGSLLDEELHAASAGPSAGAGPLDGLMAGAEPDAMAGGSHLDADSKKMGLRGLFARKKRGGPKANVWDSSLLLIGGGALLTLLILGSVLVWALRGETGDQAFQQANEEYSAGNYSQAIHKFTEYLDKFPSQSKEDRSTAKVCRGLSKLRQKWRSRDWPAALQTAKEVLGEIRPEDKFSTAHGDLAAMLQDIAAGLAAQAREKTDPQLVAQAEEALDLLELNVPKGLRPPDKIAEIKSILDLTVHDVTRGEEIAKAIKAMQQAVADHDTQQAYAIRKALARNYSKLDDNAELKQAVLAVSRAQQEAVQFVENPPPRETTEPAPTVPTVVLVQSTMPGSVAELEGHVVFAAAGGAVYGIDAATGKVLWRRYVGFDSNGQGIGFPPVAMSSSKRPGAGEPSADALLVDSTRDEVLRVKAKSGDVLWRHAIGERFDAQPVIAGDRILVATRGAGPEAVGRLVIIDTETGKSSGEIRLPQPLHVAPAIDSSRSLIFQLADHSNLFVLTLDDGQCKRVYCLGHEPGSITAPPVVLGSYLMIGVNDRAQSSSLRVLKIEQDDQSVVLKPVQRFRLEGHIDVAPVVSGQRKVLVVTDRGAVSVFEIGGDEKKPLTEIASLGATGPRDVIRYPLMQGGSCWIADVQLAKYEIQASLSQMVGKDIQDEECVFLQPLRAIGPAIFHVRRDPTTPGTLVSAVAIDQRKRFWETRLATPLAGEPVVDAAGEKIIAISSAGGVFEMSASELTLQGPFPRETVARPQFAVPANRLKRPLRNVARLAGRMLAMTAGQGAEQIVVYDPRRQDRPFQYLRVSDALACRPIVFSGGLLAPSRGGLVSLLDPQTGGKVAEPFQPPLQPGREFNWRVPAVSASHGVVLADGGTRLYRLTVADQPQANLVAADRVELSESIVSPVAVVEDMVYAVSTAGILTALRLPKLTPVEEAEQMLGGPLAWGPQRVGGRVVMLTTDKQLICVSTAPADAWRATLPYGPLAGAPLAMGEDFILASTRGTVWRLDGKGKEIAKVEIGQPLGTGPVLLGVEALGNRLLLGGHDGSLYRIELPSP